MTAQRERERRERRERPIPRGVRLPCLRDGASRHKRNDASRRASPPSGEIGNGAGQVLGPAGRERGEGRVGRQGERASERARAREREREREKRASCSARGSAAVPARWRFSPPAKRRVSSRGKESERASEREKTGPFSVWKQAAFCARLGLFAWPERPGRGKFFIFSERQWPELQRGQLQPFSLSCTF